MQGRSKIRFELESLFRIVTDRKAAVLRCDVWKTWWKGKKTLTSQTFWCYIFWQNNSNYIWHTLSILFFLSRCMRGEPTWSNLLPVSCWRSQPIRSSLSWALWRVPWMPLMSSTASQGEPMRGSLAVMCEIGNVHMCVCSWLCTCVTVLCVKLRLSAAVMGTRQCFKHKSSLVKTSVTLARTHRNQFSSPSSHFHHLLSHLHSSFVSLVRKPILQIQGILLFFCLLFSVPPPHFFI